MDFTGKTVIVTGGARGIGKAVAEGIARLGGRVVILDKDDCETAFDVPDSCAVYVRRTDLSDSAALPGIVDSIIEEFGPVSGLVNNAGVLSRQLIEDVSLEEWEYVLKVNLTAPFVLCKSLFPHMKEQGGGKIVNVSSVAGKCGGIFSGKIAYGSSKAGLIGLTKSLAREGAPYGVYCNAVCPAAVDTAMTGTPAADPNRKCPVPLGRKGTPEEIANVILFLLSGESDFVTGEISVVDGGMTMCS